MITFVELVVWNLTGATVRYQLKESKLSYSAAAWHKRVIIPCLEFRIF